MKLVFLFIFLTSFLTQAQVSTDTINQLDKEGLKTGKWLRYHNDNKTIRYIGQFERGKPTGEFRHFYSTGNLQSIATYSENGRVCHVISFYGNGSKMAEGKFIDQKREGTWTYYDGWDNVIAIDVYANGKKNGISKTFLPEGVLIEEMQYVNGEQNGIWRRFYGNGKPHIIGEVKANAWNGNFVFYNDDGKKLASGFYKNNLQHGEWNYYEENGKLVKTVEYENGNIASQKVFIKEKDIEYQNMREAEIIMQKIRSGKPDDNIIKSPFER